MTVATVAVVAGIGTNLYGAYRAARGGGSNDPANLAALADRFGSHREGWAQLLESTWGNLSSTNPAEIMKNPNFQFLKEQGLGAINAGSAAGGMFASGNRGIEGAKFASGLSTNFLNQQFNQNQALIGNLLTASGANSGNPGQASTNYGLQTAANTQGLLGGIGSALGLLGRTNWGTGDSNTPTGGGNVAGGLIPPPNPWG